MIALQIESTAQFLKLLLEENAFDEFMVGKCEVTTLITFSTDGYRRYVENEEEEHSDRVYWNELKPTVLNMINQASVPGTLELDLFKYRSRDMGSIRITFEEGKFRITTGYMQKEFSLDKRGSEDWDDECQGFLTRNNIAVTAL